MQESDKKFPNKYWKTTTKISKIKRKLHDTQKKYIRQKNRTEKKKHIYTKRVRRGDFVFTSSARHFLAVIPLSTINSQRDFSNFTPF